MHSSESSPWPLHQATARSSCQAPPCTSGRPSPCRAACPPPGCLPRAPKQAAPTGVLSCHVPSTEAEGEARSPLIPESPEPGWAPTMHRSLSPEALSNGLDGKHLLCSCHSSLPRTLRYAVLDAGLLSQVKKRVSGRVGIACSNSAGQKPPPPQNTFPMSSCPSPCGQDVLGGFAKSLQWFFHHGRGSTACSDPTSQPALPSLSSGNTFQPALFLPCGVPVVLRGRP